MRTFGAFLCDVSGRYGWRLLLSPVLALLGWVPRAPDVSTTKIQTRAEMDPPPIHLLMSPAGCDRGRPASPSQAEPWDPCLFHDLRGTDVPDQFSCETCYLLGSLPPLWGFLLVDYRVFPPHPPPLFLDAPTCEPFQRDRQATEVPPSLRRTLSKVSPSFFTLAVSQCDSG